MRVRSRAAGVEACGAGPVRRLYRVRISLPRVPFVLTSYSPFDLLAGVALDLLIGAPRWLPNPVRIVRFAARYLEALLRALHLPLRVAGLLFWIVIVGATTGAVWITLPWATIYWIYAFLSIRGLDSHAHSVMRYVEKQDLESARQQLSNIVRRDTANLTEPEIIRAVIETVAENLNDGIIAPLFYLILGGPALMAAYKAVNTLDHLVGYRNERYEKFGWASARFDDVVNFLPARLTAVLIWLSTATLWMNTGRALRITLRDAASQPSPNSGYPEAAFAGAIGVQLGGVSSYGGTETETPIMGDPVNPLNYEAWEYARALMYASTFWMVLIAIVVVGW
jgi:adenosylcobinamide-phosphate synthase